MQLQLTSCFGCGFPQLIGKKGEAVGVHLAAIAIVTMMMVA